MSTSLNRISRRHMLVCTGGVIAATSLAVACAPAQSRVSVSPAGTTPTTAPASTTTPTAGGTLRVSQSADIIPASVPYVFTPANQYTLYPLVYDTLVSYDTQLNPRPKLAASWEWSPDFLRLTVTLRQGVKFHTGRTLSSQDVKFNLDALRDPASNSQLLNYAKMMHVDAPDPSTVVITYDAPLKGSFDVLAETCIADPQTLDQSRDGKAFVGTGPYRFKDWAPGDRFSVVRNPDYWQTGKPYFDQVDVTVVPDSQTGVVNFESGAVDLMYGVPPIAARRLRDNPRYQVLLSGSGGIFYYLGLDLNVPALADKRVRQAFGYAMDRQRIIDSALYGLGRPTSIAWPRQSLAYDGAQDQTYTHDLNKARELLTAAGWDPNTTIKLAVNAGNAPTQTIAEILQQDMATIGAKLEIQKLENAPFTSHIPKGDFGSAWIATIGNMNLSPATFFSTAFPVRVPNTSNFETPRYKQLIEQSYSQTDDQQLKGTLRELTQIMLDEAFVLPVAELTCKASGAEVAVAGLKDTAWNELGWYSYEDMWLAR